MMELLQVGYVVFGKNSGGIFRGLVVLRQGATVTLVAN